MSRSDTSQTRTPQVSIPTETLADQAALLDGATMPDGVIIPDNSAAIKDLNTKHHSRAEKNASVERSRSQSKSPATALQDMFLNSLRRENIDVVVYFCDGSQERGSVRAFDTFTILLENRSSGKVQLLYKHSIARIVPTRSPSQLAGSERGAKKP